MTCVGDNCGTGGWTGPLPGDPDNNITLTATTTLGGITVAWTYPATNPHAVAYAVLFRGETPDFNLSVQHGIFSNSQFYDRIDTPVAKSYYYWLKIVSVNGTQAEEIGPAMATALPFSSQLQTELAGKIVLGTLATTLRAEIANIQVLRDDLISEANDRIAANDELGLALAQVESGLIDALTYINTETAQRTEGDNALLLVTDTLAVANENAMAAIIAESELRVDGDTAQATRSDLILARLNNVTGNPAEDQWVTLEELFTAHADRLSGLSGQWALKIQAGTADNPVIAGIGLAVDDPVDGPSSSSFNILADRLGLMTQHGLVMPFTADGTGLVLNGAIRVNGTQMQDIANGARRIQLTATSQVFKIAKDGTNTPGSITFTAVATALEGEPVFTIKRNGVVTELLGAGNTRSLPFASMTHDIAEITVTQDGMSDVMSVVKLREGTDAITGFLTNETHTIPADKDGNNGVYTGASTGMKVYIGATDDTANWSFSRTNSTGVTSSLSGNTVTVTNMTLDASFVDITASRSGYPSITKRFSLSKSKAGNDGQIGGAGDNAKLLYLSASSQVFQVAKSGAGSPGTITLNASAQYLEGTPTWAVVSGTATLVAGANDYIKTLAFSSMSTDTVTVEVTQDGQTDRITIVKVREGADGANAITGLLSNESHTLSADLNGTVSSFSGATTAMNVFEGTVDTTASWTISRVSGSGVTSTLSGNSVSVTAMSGDTGYVDISATRSGYATITKRFSLSKAKAGNNGSSAKLLAISATAQVIQVNKSGVASPSSVTFSSTAQNLSGSPTYSVIAGTGTLVGATLSYANMGSDSVTVRVSQDGLTDTITVVKVREGTDGNPGNPGTPGENGEDGLDGDDAITAFLTNEAHTLPADAAGNVLSTSGASCTMKVFVGAVDDSAAWSFSASPSSSPSLTYSRSGGTVTVSGMSAATDSGYVDITATKGVNSVTKRFSLSKSKTGVQGDGAKALFIAATSQVFQINKAGDPSPSSITFSASSQNLGATTPTFSVIAGSATLNGATLNFASMVSDSVTVQVSQGGLTDTVTVVKLREGANGAKGDAAVSALLTNETHTLAADKDGVVGSYTGAATTMKVYVGVTDDSASWTFSASPVSDSNLTYSHSNGTVTVTAMAAANTADYVDITATKAGFSAITKRFSINKSKTGLTGSNGTRGTVNVVVSGAYGPSWPSDGGHAAFASAGYGAAIKWDVMTITNGSTYSETRYNNGSNAWVPLAAYFNGNMLVTGTVTARYLDAASGTLGDLHIIAGGGIHGGPYSSWNWPAAGAGDQGFYIGPEGLKFGNYNAHAGYGWFAINSLGDIYAPKFTIINGQISIESPVISNPTLDAFSVSLDTSAIYMNTSNGTVNYEVLIANPSGGKGTITYKWSIVITNPQPNISCGLSTASGGSTMVTGNATNNTVEAEVTCVATDANGRTASAVCSVFVTHGTPP